ncbi:MAG: hypothetical protein KA291_02195 [Psychrobacter sp.]|nr:hypothetical protein [Psychrobacter sp.]
MSKDKSYYDQFNNCDDIKNQYDYFTVLEAALIWCGIPSDQLEFEASQCQPKGDDNGLQRGTFIHPYVSCVEPRCLVLHQAFEDNYLKMGRDGGVSGFKDFAVGHIAHLRRTIKIADLKKYIKDCHANDMPKSLYPELDANQDSQFDNEQHLLLKAENENLIARLNKASDIYRQNKSEIEELTEKNKKADIEKAELIEQLKSQAAAPDDDKELKPNSQSGVARMLYAILMEHNYDLSPPMGKGLANDLIVNASQVQGTPVTKNFVAEWLKRANQAKINCSKK